MTGHPMRLGERMRRARKRQKLTLQRVAARTSLSIGFLSQVERNITTPSLASLSTIARVLDVPVSALLNNSDIPNALSLRESRIPYSLHANWISYERISSTETGHMLDAHKINVPPRYVSEVASHDGEEIVYVLAGSVRYTIAGTIYELNTGDALHFSTHRPHSVSNPTDEPAEMLSLRTQQPPGDGFHGSLGKGRTGAADDAKPAAGESRRAQDEPPPDKPA